MYTLIPTVCMNTEINSQFYLYVSMIIGKDSTPDNL